jgi:hypothetical protein
MIYLDTKSITRIWFTCLDDNFVAMHQALELTITTFWSTMNLVHIPMLLVVIHELFTTFHLSFHYNHQFKIPYIRQTWMHNTNGGEITSQCVLLRNEVKMNHATMEVNGMNEKKKCNSLLMNGSFLSIFILLLIYYFKTNISKVYTLKCKKWWLFHI